MHARARTHTHTHTHGAHMAHDFVSVSGNLSKGNLIARRLVVQ